MNPFNGNPLNPLRWHLWLGSYYCKFVHLTNSFVELFGISQCTPKVVMDKSIIWFVVEGSIYKL